MEKYLQYYYNISGINIYDNDNSYKFELGNDKYIFFPYYGDIKYLNEVFDFNNDIIRQGVACNQIVLTKDNMLFVVVNNKNYVLIKYKKEYEKKVTINDILNFKYYVHHNKFNCSNWKNLWETKMNYFEYQLNQFGYKHPILRESFGYYSGYVELAIQLLNNLKVDNTYLAHRRIKKDYTLPKSKSIDQFVKSIASCPNTVLNYFFEPFKINPNFDYSEPTFIFPYAGEVLDHMIKQNKKNTSIYIKKAIQWNKEVINQLKELIDKSVVNYKKIYDYLQDEDYVRKVALEYYYYFPNVGFVGYTDTSEKSSKRFITNIVQVTAKSPNQELQSLTDELNESHKPLEAFLQEQKKLDKH